MAQTCAARGFDGILIAHEDAPASDELRERGPMEVGSMSEFDDSTPAGGDSQELFARTLHDARVSPEKDLQHLAATMPDVWLALETGVLGGANLADREREDRQERYQVYLDSLVWQEKRQMVLARAEYKCERCGQRSEKDTPLEVHHVVYGERGEEDGADLEALCADCHAAQHPEMVFA
jgi:hypothetical protein